MLAQGPEPGTIAAVTAALLAGTATIVAAVLQYLAGRDKLRYDADMVKLKEAVAACEGDRQECRELIEELRGRCDQVQARADEAENTAARLEGQYQAAEREIAGLREEVHDLRDRLYRGKS